MLKRELQGKRRRRLLFEDRAVIIAFFARLPFELIMHPADMMAEMAKTASAAPTLMGVLTLGPIAPTDERAEHNADTMQQVQSNDLPCSRRKSAFHISMASMAYVYASILPSYP